MRLSLSAQHCSNPDCSCPHHTTDTSQLFLYSAILEGMDCLLHQESCQKPRCPCRDMRRRLHDLLPESPLPTPRIPGKPDVSDTEQNSEAQRYVICRRTQIIEQPGVSHVATPSFIDRGSVHSLTSPPSSPPGGKRPVFSLTASAPPPALPPPSRKISLSVDKLPLLCLSDSSLTSTPLQSPQSSSDANKSSTAHHFKIPVLTSTTLPTRREHCATGEPSSNTSVQKHSEKKRQEHYSALTSSGYSTTESPDEVGHMYHHLQTIWTGAARNRTSHSNLHQPKSISNDLDYGEISLHARPRPSSLAISPSKTSPVFTRQSPLQTSYLKHPKKALLKQEAPSIYCGKCPMPDCMTLISTVSDVTSGGVKFFSKSNDFTLDIPRGAVPENERLTLDVGVALFGPFQFPEGFRPVSPVFWVCVRDNSTFHFSKSVTVTIPHFLSLRSDEDVQSLGLTFLKAKHNKNMEGIYEFCEIDGAMNFQASSKFGVLETSHFCSLCIVCRDTPECLNKTQFCMTSLLPKSAMADGTKQDAYFFVTFYNLTTCLTKVDELIAEKGLGGHQKSQVGFHFKKFTKNHALEMVITQPKHGKIGVLGKKQVL